MEKKMILALVLVLAITSSAHAALSMNLSATSANVGAAVTITISSDVAEEITWGVYLDPVGVFPANAQLQTATVLALAGNQAAVTAGSNPDAGHYYRSRQGGQALPSIGDWSTVEFVGLTAGTYWIDLDQPAGGAELDTQSITVTVVPEPATIALLGLGGLFLLRRRR